MIRSLWIAKTGLDAQQTQMDVISNNLANVSTSGSSVLAPCSKI
jgi:flagellar basal-body rod protein FlgG